MGPDGSSGPPPSFSEDRWNPSFDELVEALEKFHKDNNVDAKTMDEEHIARFLDLHFHVVSGTTTMSHHSDIKDILDEMAKPGWKSPTITTEEMVAVRSRARVFVESPEKLWAEIIDVLDAVIVGERLNKVSLLCLVQGMEHIFVTGDSSSGKSYLKDNVLRLFPQEWIKSYGGASEKSLQYTDWQYQGPGPEENPLIRILNLQEFVGIGEEQDKQLRLLSGDDGGMKWTVTVRDKETGGFVTEEGQTPPLCFVTSTTRTALNPENMTRAWRLIPNPDVTQTENILKRDNLLAALPHRRPRLLERLNVIRECMRILDPKPWKTDDNKFRVAQPFLPLCRFPYDKVRVRRDRSKVERMSAIITIFNQHNRVRYTFEGFEYLLGTAGDLALSLYLTQDILEHTLLGIDDKALRTFKVVEQWEKELAEEGESEDVDGTKKGMTIQNLMESGRLLFSQKKLQDVCRELVNTGFLYTTTIQAVGNPKAYHVRDVPDARLSVDWTKKKSLLRTVMREYRHDGIELPESVEDMILDESFPEVLRELVEEVPLIADMRRRMEIRKKVREERGTLAEHTEREFDNVGFKDIVGGSDE